jgi:hypothetical protein
MSVETLQIQRETKMSRPHQPTTLHALALASLLSMASGAQAAGWSAQLSCPGGGVGTGGSSTSSSTAGSNSGPSASTGSAPSALADLVCDNSTSSGNATLSGSGFISGQQWRTSSNATLSVQGSPAPTYVPGVGTSVQDDLTFQDTPGWDTGELVLHVQGAIKTQGALVDSPSALVLDFYLQDTNFATTRISATFDLHAATGSLSLNTGSSTFSRDTRLVSNSVSLDGVDLELRLPYFISGANPSTLMTMSSTLTLRTLLGGEGQQTTAFTSNIWSDSATGVPITTASGRVLASAVPEPSSHLLMALGLGGLLMQARRARRR